MGLFRILYSMTMTEIFKVIFSNWLFWQANAEQCNMLLLQIESRVFSIENLRSSYVATIFNSTNVELWICRKRWELAQNSQERILLAFIFAIALGDYEYWTSWSLPKFSRSNVLLIWISIKKIAGSGCPLRICFDSHGPRLPWSCPRSLPFTYDLHFKDESFGILFGLRIFRK